MKIKLADIYRTLKENNFSDQDTIENLCRETQYLRINEQKLIPESDVEERLFDVLTELKNTELTEENVEKIKKFLQNEVG